MARPKSFDRDEALDQAVQVFWDQGYQATSMSDLRRAMGIGRQSLYDTFGDKEQLFDEVLRRYLEWNDERLSTALPPDAGLGELRAHLHAIVAGVTQHEPRRGCLLMRTCTSIAPDHEAFAAISRAGLQAISAAFERVLRQAKARGELRADVDPSAAARCLTSQTAGLGVMAQAGASEEELLAIVETALDGLQAR